jgi:hypothetical protein
MSVKELNNAPGTWVYVVCALMLLGLTCGVIVAVKHLPCGAGWLARLWNKEARKGYARLDFLMVDADSTAEVHDGNMHGRQISTTNFSQTHMEAHVRYES